MNLLKLELRACHFVSDDGILVYLPVLRVALVRLWPGFIRHSITYRSCRTEDLASSWRQEALTLALSA
jgi:hypothetical protein